jgi:Flp pilus assembly protein TadG
MNTKHQKSRMRKKSLRTGAAITEFAIIGPLLVLLAMGGIDVAQAVNVGQVINDASREGARQASRSDVTTVDEVQAFVRDYVGDAFPNLSSGSVGSAVTVEVQGENGYAPTGGDLSTLDSGSPIVVNVSLQFGVVQLTKFIPGFDQIVVQTSTVMRRE